MASVITEEEVASTSKQLLTGILSNPNYNFTNIQKAVDDAVAHARALLNKLATVTDQSALSVDAEAKKIEAATAPETTADIPAGDSGGTTVGETEPK